MLATWSQPCRTPVILWHRVWVLPPGLCWSCSSPGNASCLFIYLVDSPFYWQHRPAAATSVKPSLMPAPKCAVSFNHANHHSTRLGPHSRLSTMSADWIKHSFHNIRLLNWALRWQKQVNTTFFFKHNRSRLIFWVIILNCGLQIYRTVALMLSHCGRGQNDRQFFFSPSWGEKRNSRDSVRGGFRKQTTTPIDFWPHSFSSSAP